MLVKDHKHLSFKALKGYAFSNSKGTQFKVVIYYKSHYQFPMNYIFGTMETFKTITEYFPYRTFCTFL